MANNFWKGRRVLVTGGSGFIGFALARHLLTKAANVSILDIKPLPSYATAAERSAFSFVRGSVTSQETVRSLIKRRRIKTIFHLAAEAIVDRALEAPAQTLDANVRGTWVILESHRACPSIEEIIVASSDHVYGSHTKPPYTERSPLVGESPYDVSKSCADLIAQMYAKTCGVPVAIARCGNVYGPGDLNWSRLIPDALRSHARGTPLRLRSSGHLSRDYVYIDDIIDAYSALAQNVHAKKLSGEAFNFGTGKPLAALDVLGRLGTVLGERVQFSIANTARHEIRALFLDSSKARRALSWRPKLARDEGFRRTCAWYGDFLK